MKTIDGVAEIDVTIEYEYRPGDASRIRADQEQPPDGPDLSKVKVLLSVPVAVLRTALDQAAVRGYVSLDISGLLTPREYENLCDDCWTHERKG